MASSTNFFSAAQQELIKQAIMQAEENTSGEIRVRVEDKCAEDPVDNAMKAFEALKMHETELRNGVLFYLAVADKKFAIVGDGGINEVVPANFWDHIKDHMLLRFKEGKFTEGLCEGLQKAGEQLKKHFPRKSNDVNELQDDISFGD